MTILIDRDLSLSSEDQKNKIIEEYEKNDKKVTFIQSLYTGKNRGKILLMYKEEASSIPIF